MILIVDDDPSVTASLGLLLKQHGRASLAASGPDEALRLLKQQPCELVLQDMNFGAEKTSGEQGIRLFERVRELDPDVPVVLMTAWASLETAVQLIKEGANDYLAKP